MSDGFTSARIGPKATSALTASVAAKPSVRKLAAAMIAEVEPGRRRHDPPDLVLVVDDLELANQDQPAAVVSHSLRAIHLELHERSWTTDASRTRAEERLAERCSFHLLAPMVEAYFYGEPAAPQRAGASRASLFSTGTADVEQFQVDDPTYLGVPDKLRPWATVDRARHAKRYLDYLCTDPADPLTAPSAVRHYRETAGGQRSLATLDWRLVLTDPAHAPFAHSLFDDIAAALAVPNPVPGSCSAITERKSGGSLRNLMAPSSVDPV